MKYVVCTVCGLSRLTQNCTVAAHSCGLLTGNRPQTKTWFQASQPKPSEHLDFLSRGQPPALCPGLDLERAQSYSSAAAGCSKLPRYCCQNSEASEWKAATGKRICVRSQVCKKSKLLTCLSDHTWSIAIFLKRLAQLADNQMRLSRGAVTNS